MDSLSTVVNALREQRRELGSALHRGPAQALTAARLELSMLGEKVELGPLQEALEDASEGLVGLVHGKLHGRTKGESLDAALRAEIHFQARWHDLPSEGDAITLPHSPLNTTLTRLWRLAGGHIEEDNTQTTFLLTEISR